MEYENILDLIDLCKSFPGVQALDRVTFSIRKGEIHAIVGENGAGKSTLIKIIAGVYVKDSGKVLFNDEEIENPTPLDSIRKGISTVHQELRLVEALSVAENIYLGVPFENHTFMGSFIDWGRVREEAREFIDSMGVDINVDAHVSDLSVAKKQVVEICKALSRNAQMVIMDEPSATLTEKELDILFRIIRKLKQDGITIIYISHRLEEIFQIADRVTVMRDGKHIITDDTVNLDKKRLINYMVGREIENIYPTRNSIRGNKLLEVKGLKRTGVLNDISLTLHEGEILGVAGLVGSGRTELARAIFGVDRIDGGSIFIRDKEHRITSIQDAIKHKLALVPEDRKIQGVILDLPVSTNITLVGIDKVIKNTFIDTGLEKHATGDFIKLLRIQTPRWDQLIKYLSGGNQQKCVLAKWLFVDSDILIFDEPTRGIDVGAKQEIYRLLNELAGQGKGIIMISSELPEILGLSDRILVMHDGKITGELDPRTTNQEEIMHYATL
jgi:ribose transport system ATP-binding protein